MGEIARFIIFIGPCSSVFDYTTYLMMWFLFGCWNLGLVPPRDVAAHFIHAGAGPDYTYAAALFQTGWFVESLLTQTLIIHVIRTNKIPFIQSRASWQLIITTGAIMLAGMWLPSSPIGPWMGLVPLPIRYWPLLLITLISYVVLTQGVKVWLIRRNWI
jgi:P-type Mg2+ transporter